VWIFSKNFCEMIVSFLDCENSKLINFEDIRHSHLSTVNESWVQQKALLLRWATIRKMTLNYDLDSKRLLNYDFDPESQSIDFERIRLIYNDIYLRKWVHDRSKIREHQKNSAYKSAIIRLVIRKAAKRWFQRKNIHRHLSKKMNARSIKNTKTANEFFRTRSNTNSKRR
jgi:hypothetical protein